MPGYLYRLSNSNWHMPNDLHRKFDWQTPAVLHMISNSWII